MPRTLQFKRFANTVVANTTGANGEFIIDSTNQTITIHDGVTRGGHRMASKNYVDNIGIQGAQGATGIQGASGVIGVQGATGISGATGSAGTNGATGVNGASGVNGATGIDGATGSAGANGATGIDGATGSAGTNGATGVTGASGVNGATGIDGATGSAGTNGATGVDGASGIQGASGVTGATGSSGTNGATGIDGATGVSTQGATGVSGATGSQGTIGAGNLLLLDSFTGAYTVSFGEFNLNSYGNGFAVRKDGSVVDAYINEIIALGNTNWTFVPVGDPANTVTKLMNTPQSNVSLGDDPGHPTWVINTNDSMVLPISATNGTPYSIYVTNLSPFGTNGASGVSGASGVTGATGSAGTNGATGAGIDGATGSAGTNGATGVSGATGPSGTNGVDGASGVIGATGLAGINGASGVQGASGILSGPAFRTYVSIAQSITSGTQQKITFGGETFDTNNNFASSTFTPTVSGYYQLNATVRLDGTSGTGECMIILYKNGSEYARGTNESGTIQGSSFWSMQVSDVAYANGSSDTFEIYVQQGSGGDVLTTAGQAISYFSGVLVRST